MYSKVYLEITNICNKSCSFCHGTKRTPRSMSIEKFDSITDSLIGVTEYIYLHIMGEPLLHPELISFIRLAADKGFKVCITTNGSLLKKMGEELLASPVYKINISLHSFENGSNEEYKNYINECLTFADKSSNNGILTVLRLWNNGFDNGRNEAILSTAQKTLAGEWHKGSRGFRIRNRLHLEYGERFSWPDINAKEGDSSVFCYALKDQLGILCDGTVVPCCLDSDGEIKLGNILETPLNEILNSKRAIALRDGFKNRKATEKLCRRCGYARRF